MTDKQFENEPQRDSADMPRATLEQQLRQQSKLLCARLTTSGDPTHDDALRQDIADIAAKMLVLTAAREGDTSPIPAFLAPSLLSESDPDAASSSKLIAKVKAMAPQLLKS